jgi:hypothetical protein
MISTILATLAAGAAATASAMPHDMMTAAAVTRMPTDVEIGFEYPRPAYRARISGAATIQCGLDEHAGAQNCAVTSEEPAGRGFGDAALKLVPFMSFAIPTDNGDQAPIIAFTIVFTNPNVDKWPNYSRIPTAEDVARLWPSRPFQRMKVGCRVEVDGTPDACEVLDPEHPSPAIQAAAVRFMTAFHFSPAIRDGHPVPAVAIVPLAFGAP